MVQERPKLIFSVKLSFTDLHLSTRSLYASCYSSIKSLRAKIGKQQLHNCILTIFFSLSRSEKQQLFTCFSYGPDSCCTRFAYLLLKRRSNRVISLFFGNNRLKISVSAQYHTVDSTRMRNSISCTKLGVSLTKIAFACRSQK